MSQILVGILFICCGIFSIFCAIKDYDWFMENRRAWLFVKLFGRNGARGIYVLIGVAIIVMAFTMFFFGDGPRQM